LERITKRAWLPIIFSDLTQRFSSDLVQRYGVLTDHATAVVGTARAEGDPIVRPDYTAAARKVGFLPIAAVVVGVSHSVSV
jgi:hypothetical protein